MNHAEVVQKVLKQDEKYFLQYVRSKRRERVGVVVGFPGLNRIGWSRVHGKLDKFDVARGVEIATHRAMTGWGDTVRIPDDTQRVIDEMNDRIYRYHNPKEKTNV